MTLFPPLLSVYTLPLPLKSVTGSRWYFFSNSLIDLRPFTRSRVGTYESLRV